MNEIEKAKMGAATLQLFCNQFGDDVHSRIFLEVLLEGIINAETLFVFGEQEQEGPQADHSASEPGINKQFDKGSERTRSTQNLGIPDLSDYP